MDDVEPIWLQNRVPWVRTSVQQAVKGVGGHRLGRTLRALRQQSDVLTGEIDLMDNAINRLERRAKKLEKKRDQLGRT